MFDLRPHWGIAAEPIATSPTTWEVADHYILKLVKAENHAQSNVRLSAALRAAGVPVPSILRTKDGRDYATTPEGCYLLMEKLSGSHIRGVLQQDYTEIAFETGSIIAKIHRALAAIPDQPTTKPYFDGELQGWIHEELTTGSLLSPEEWESSVEALCHLYPRLPKQPIHRDLHYGNLLFTGTALTGVLDFDLGKQDARLFDIAYFLLGQLIDQKDLAAIREPWLDFVRRFLRGYKSVTALEPAEKVALPFMMQCIELLFAAYWQRQQNPEAAREAVRIFQWIDSAVFDHLTDYNYIPQSSPERK